jgi:hypothetical protein
MTNSEIQSQWNHENSRLQNFRAIFLTINIVLLSLLNFVSLKNYSGIRVDVIKFLFFIFLGFAINSLWIILQREITKNVDRWGNLYLKKIDKDYKVLFNKTHSGIGIRKIYFYLPFCFILFWVLVIILSLIV